MCRLLYGAAGKPVRSRPIKNVKLVYQRRAGKLDQANPVR